MSEDPIPDISLLAFIDGTALVPNATKTTIRRALDGNTSIRICDRDKMDFFLARARNVGSAIRRNVYLAIDGKVAGEIHICENCGIPFVRKSVSQRYCEWWCKPVPQKKRD